MPATAPRSPPPPGSQPRPDHLYRLPDPGRAPIPTDAAGFPTLHLDAAASRPSTVRPSTPSLSKRLHFPPLYSWQRQPTTQTSSLALFGRIGYMCGGSCMSDLELCPLFEMESNNWTARIKQQLNSIAYSGDKCPEESLCVVFEQYIKNRFASYAGEQVTGEPVGEVRAVSGMHERKDEMVRSADAFIALPEIIQKYEAVLKQVPVSLQKHSWSKATATSIQVEHLSSKSSTRRRPS